MSAKYTINPAVYSSMTPIPAAIIDENLRLAGACQLKTILLFLRRFTVGQPCSAQDIAAEIGFGTEDVEDALIFWADRGILISENQTVSFPVPDSSTEPENELNKGKAKPAPKESKAELPIVKPSFEQVSSRLQESAEIEFLFNEAQTILGRTIGFSGQSTLLMIHDSYGLDVSVILTLITYLKSVGKSGMNQIASTAKLWSELEISNVEEAEEYISSQNLIDTSWREFQSATGIKNSKPTSKQSTYFKRWVEEYKLNMDLIVLAYEKSVENTGKFTLEYTEKILKSWSDSNISTVKEANSQKPKNEANKTPKQKSSSKKPSYDLDKYGAIGMKLKKKG